MKRGLSIGRSSGSPLRVVERLGLFTRFDGVILFRKFTKQDDLAVDDNPRVPLVPLLNEPDSGAARSVVSSDAHVLLVIDMRDILKVLNTIVVANAINVVNLFRPLGKMPRPNQVMLQIDSSAEVDSSIPVPVSAARTISGFSFAVLPVCFPKDLAVSVIKYLSDILQKELGPFGFDHSESPNASIIRTYPL
jgi:hypothetical protein